jgi:beta-glucanase (GH16 family)
VSPTADSKGTQVLIDADGPGGNWGVTVVVLNGLLAWNVGGEVLFNGVLPPAPPPLDLTKLTLVPGSSDEFTGTAVDWTKWRSRWNYVAADASGCNLPSNGEQQWYVNHESTALSSLTPWVVANGQLTLVGDKLPDALKPLCGYATDANHPLGSYGYYSGMLQNSPVCSQTYGYFEVSVTMPKGQGLWPAFWLLPTDGSWPPEIDIFEQLGNDPSLFYFTKHYVQASDGSGQSEGLAVHVDTTGTHPIGLWWDANYLIVYVDGVEQGRVTNTNLTKPMYVVINLAVGGNWGGNPDATTVFPAKLVFDYVRVYTINP